MTCMPAMLVIGCGSGGGSGVGTPGSTTYEVSTFSGAHGVVSPSVITVNPGDTASLTLTADSGYVASGASGCGGTLSGNTYTTGPITVSCGVTADFSAVFTWLGGSNTPDANGVYGALGTPAASSTPGARHSAATWTDSKGDLWLFGGYGVGTPRFNDLWKYAPSSGEWTWVAGPDTINGFGSYGTKGVAAATNNPGSGGPALTWTDASGNLWMFGAFGYDSVGNSGWLNTLWEYSPTNGLWTWQGGSNVADANGVYGTLGTAAATNIPGARVEGGGSLPNGDVLIFGGFGYDSVKTSAAFLSDLWEYSPSSGEWTWIGGPNTANATPVYGTQGTAAAANTPGGRLSPTWTDSSGNLWVFGGLVYDPKSSTSTQGNPSGLYNDLWEYSQSSGEWTWIGGSETAGAKGVYGTLGAASATNIPGAREGDDVWRDASGNVWLFGGYGYDSKGTLGELNDLWKYSPSNGQWTWVAGSDTANAAGDYGTLGTSASTNILGARDDAPGWLDGSGNIWVFGGEGYNSSGADPNAPEYNDLWKYPTQ